ncbi:MAG: Fic family protein [Bacteroidales bacterium]
MENSICHWGIILVSCISPPGNQNINQDRLENLMDFVNDDENYKIDLLLKMAIAHFQFEAIHPFRGRHGRTGRIFNVNYLTNKGLLDVPILFLSRSYWIIKISERTLIKDQFFQRGLFSIQGKNLFFAKALPDPDFKYFSNSIALYLS